MGWWFGRKAAPDMRPFVPAWLNAGGGTAFVRSYEAQFDEVFRNNPVGQRAVRLLSGLLGSLTVYCAEGDEAAARVVSGELLEAMGAALLLHGNAYAQLLTDADEKPAELVMLRPERVKVETDAQGWPVGLQVLDTLIAAAVVDLPANDPPQSPSAGDCYLVGDAPTGEWSQFPGNIAAFGGGGWRFIAPREGMTVLVTPSGFIAAYRAGAWEMGAVRASRLMVDGMQVVGAQAAAIADPAGGATIDAQVRATVSEMLAALRQHGLISA